MKTIIIGLDGASFRVIEENIDELPTLSTFIREGYSSKLISTDPPTTSVAWPAFSTSQNPGAYGIYDFMNRDPATMEFQLNDARESLEGFFWQYMDEEIGLASIPLIPYHDTDGFFVQGSLARINEEQICDPPRLSADLPEEYDYRIDWRDDNEDIISGVKRRVEDRGAFYEELLRQFDLDMYFLMFNAIDHIQHHFWAYMDETHPAHEPSEYEDVVLNIYKQVDSVLADLRRQLDSDANVFIVSDHGFQPNRMEVNINSVLEERGYLDYEVDLSGSILTKVHNIVKQYLSHEQITTIVPRIFQDAAREKMPINEHIGEAFNWHTTRAYSFGVMPNIYLNLEGREKHGTVSVSEYENLVCELREVFLSLETPDGQQAFEQVKIGEELYEGTFEDLAPDLVLKPSEGVYCKSDINGPKFKKKTEAMPNSGVHEREGILIAHGPSIKQNASVSESSHDIIDVGPTILKMHGYAPGQNFDGTAIDEALVESSAGDRFAEYREKARIRDRVLSLHQLEEV
jgi:predicted AlkP superfamily phosphohydrolase/phosphomutase